MAKVTLQQISKAVMPMIAAALIVLVIFTYFPRAAYTTGTSVSTDVAADDSKIQAGGRRVEQGFEYSSGTNTEWLSVEQIQEMLKTVKEH